MVRELALALLNDPLVHYLAREIAGTTNGTGSTPGNSAVVITLITTAGTVVAAGIAAIAATFRRENSAHSTVASHDNALARELRRRAEHAEALNDSHETEIDRLERLLIANHINPDDGSPL